MSPLGFPGFESFLELSTIEPFASDLSSRELSFLHLASNQRYFLQIAFP